MKLQEHTLGRESDYNLLAAKEYFAVVESYS